MFDCSGTSGDYNANVVIVFNFAKNFGKAYEVSGI